MRIRRQRGESSPAVPSWFERRGEHIPTPRSGHTDAERIAALATSAGAPVEAVLREVADFRLALETDMIIAAAAVDADNLDLAAELVDGERAGLVAFHERMLERLVEVARSDADELAARRARSDRFGARARIVAAAAALVAIVSGGATLAPSGESALSTEQVALELADAQLSTLTGEIVRDASTAEIAVAADELHETLEALIADHAEGDPVMAMKIAALIHEEQRLLRVDRSPAAVSVLHDVARLVRQLRLKAPAKVIATLAPIASPPAPSPKAERKPSASASAKPSPKPSQSASPKPSATPKPSASSSPAEDPGPGPLPTTAP